MLPAGRLLSQSDGAAHHQWEVGRHVVEAAAGRLDDYVVRRQPNVGGGAAVVLLDVGLEVSG
jgi:hypothetical protein